MRDVDIVKNETLLKWIILACLTLPISSENRMK